MRKKKKIGLIIVVIVLLTVSYFIYETISKKTYFITDHEYLYDTAIEFLKKNTNDSYQDKEGYQRIISYKGFGISEDDTYKYAYMWILDESYYVKNEKLYSGSGSSIAYKFTFKDNKVSKYEMPKDGSYYQSSMKKLFPKTVYYEISKFNSNLLSKENEQKIKKHYSYLKSTKVNYESSYKYNEFTLKENDNCQDEVKEYYKKQNQTIYLVCADDFYIKDLINNGEELTLKEYLETSSQTLDNSIKKVTDELDKAEIYKDGGTTVYKNNDISLIQCNTIEGNRDIYIGNSTLKYQGNYCR